jgi:hypothetical protein
MADQQMGFIGFLILILAFTGFLMTSWYAGSSNGSLDSSFGNHCLAATEGSSGPDGISNSSFDSSNQEKCDDRVGGGRREGYRCKTLAGQGAGAWSNTAFLGAGAQNASVSRKFYNQARACNTAFYQAKKPSRSGYQANGAVTGPSGRIMAEMQNRKGDMATKMVDMNNAPANVKQAMMARKNGSMATAQSKMGGSGTFAAGTVGAMTAERCRDGMTPDELNLPSEYVFDGAGQFDLWNSQLNMARAKGDVNAMLTQASELYSRRGQSNRTSTTPDQRAQMNLNVANSIRQQRGLGAAKEYNKRQAMGNFVSGDDATMNVVGNTSITSNLTPSGGAALTQWPQNVNGTWPGRCATPVNLFNRNGDKKKVSENFQQNGDVNCNPCFSPALYNGLAKRRMTPALAIMTGITGGGCV